MNPDAEGAGPRPTPDAPSVESTGENGVASTADAGEAPEGTDAAGGDEGGRTELPGLTLAVVAMGRFFLCAASLGLAGWQLSMGERLVPYVVENALDRPGRDNAVRVLATALVAAPLLWTSLRLAKRMSASRLMQVSRRFWPLVLAGPVLLLFNWRLWQPRPLLFLLLVSCAAFGLVRTWQVAATAPRVFPRVSLLPRLVALQCWFRAHGARLERVPPFAVVLVGAAAYAAYFGYHTLQYHWNGYTSSWDLGILDNLEYGALHGGGLFRSTPFNGDPNVSHLCRHATFFAYVIAPIYALAPRAETLLLVQALLVGASAIPLFLFARRHVGQWPACLVAGAFLLHPGVHGSNLYDFHFVTVSPVFVFAMVLAFETKRDWLAWAMTLLLLSIREDMGAGVAVIGLYLLLSGRRPISGLGAAVLGASYFLFMKLWVMPDQYGEPTFQHAYAGLLPPGEQGFRSIIETIVANPAYAASTLLDQQKLVFSLQMLVPVLLLPLRRWSGILLLLPGVFLLLLTTAGARPAMLQLGFQYPALVTPFLFIGTVFGLATVDCSGASGRGPSPRRLAPWLGGLALATLAVSYQFGAVLQTHTAHSGFDAFRFETTFAERDLRAVRAEVLARLPPRASVAASSRLVPHVSNRARAYTLFQGVFDADYVVIDFGLPNTREDDLAQARRLLARREFGVVEIRPPYALLARGHCTDQNRDLLRLLAPHPKR